MCDLEPGWYWTKLAHTGWMPNKLGWEWDTQNRFGRKAGEPIEIGERIFTPDERPVLKQP